jgi:hypothetical protein
MITIERIQYGTPTVRTIKTFSNPKAVAKFFDKIDGNWEPGSLTSLECFKRRLALFSERGTKIDYQLGKISDANLEILYGLLTNPQSESAAYKCPYFICKKYVTIDGAPQLCISGQFTGSNIPAMIFDNYRPIMIFSNREDRDLALGLSTEEELGKKPFLPGW